MLPWLPSYIGLYSNSTLENFGNVVFVFFILLHGAFILSPIASTVIVLREKRIAPYILCIFPVLAFINGISAVPYLANIVPVGTLRTFALVIVNGGVIAAVFLAPKLMVPRNA